MSIGSGVNYLSSLLNVTGGLQIQYLFSGTGGVVIESSPFAKVKYSGVLQNPTNFYDKAGSGTFNGNNFIRVSNSSGLNSDNFSILMTYESTGLQSSILLSSYSSGAIISGFVLGLASTNQIFLEYYSAAGPQVYLSQNNWASKNAILMSKNNNSISLSYFDMNKKVFESEQFPIQNQYFLWSDNLTIGGGANYPSFFSGGGFKGYIDNFLLWKPGLLPNQYDVVSGIYSYPLISPGSITSGIQSVVTGSYINSVAIFTGATGSQNQLISYITGACGDVNPVYATIPLTGIIYNQTLTSLSTNITNFFTGESNVSIIENSGYSKSFNMDAVSYLKNSDQNDISELYYFQTVNKNNINLDLNFDRTLNKFITPVQYNQNQLNFYIDSVSQFISGYSQTGGFYNLGIEMSGMGFVSGNYLSGDWDATDSNITDIISGQRAYSSGGYWIIGGNTGISGIGLANSLVFLGGVKLKSGLDYRISGSDLVLNDPYYYQITGRWWTMPRDSDTFTSGTWNNLTVNKFARNCTQLYQNGLRQSINNDYLELSQFSPLNNTSHYLNDLPGIYQNENNFIENLNG